jgi:hypothetical protein
LHATNRWKAVKYFLLLQEGRQQQLLSFQSSNEEVLDVQWCPSNSTVFGAVTAGGRLELWDFGASTLRPVLQHASTKCAMTALLFAKVGKKCVARVVTCQSVVAAFPVIAWLLFLALLMLHTTLK